MRGKGMFVMGLAIGYVLGTRAGRERYEQIVRVAQRVRSNPTVQEAAGMVQAQTSRLITSGRGMVRTTLNDRFGSSRFSVGRVSQQTWQDRNAPRDRPPRDTPMGF